MNVGIDEQTLRFADGLTHTVRAVCPAAPEFRVDIAGEDPWKAAVLPKENAPIVLSIGGRELLDLVVSYRCTMSTQHPYMLIESSTFGLRPHGGGEWLARLDHLHRPSASVPCSHLHVHAHRDAWTFIMSRDGRGSKRGTVKRRGRAEKAPQISDIHFPVGGPRLRPTLEDFLTMAIEDLGIDHPVNARKELDRARARWRLEQTRSIVRSSSDIAADVLREMGWVVTPPESYETQNLVPEWLERY
ncbi:hypothetical protein E4J66_07535 [Actinomyces viscosus]|uniref:Uncharacterized protein n=2 Tax=Actinomyces viscosus TaxID=1656 RepID=A0A448PMQ7_ACTVI|nr:hypothetical protein E4J66_07535 [Actinomyces viscosus]VEI17259.1 Uncharacterised protein [Actinomyces viscosus]